MGTIKIYFDYGAWPVLRVQNNVYDYDFFNKINNIEIKRLIESIENKYENLFTNSENEFSLLGFESEDSKIILLNKIEKLITLLKNEYPEDEIDGSSINDIKSIPVRI